MGIIIFITVIVFAISMYDFYSTRKWQQVTSNVRNEVVFEDRNKSYGAYQIRRNYDRNLILIFIGLFASFGVGYAALNFFSEVHEAPVEIPDDPFVIGPDDVVYNLKLDPKVKPPVGSKSNVGPTVQNLVLIVSDEQGEVAPTQDDMENANSSHQTTDGSEGTEFGTNHGTVDGEGDGDGAGGDGDDNAIIDIIQFEASFPGGLEAMKKYLGARVHYPERAIEERIQGKVYLRFVVGKSGEIESVDVIKGIVGCPECDAEAKRVVKGMPKWNPGKHNGKVVRSYFNLPIAFTLK